MPSDKQVFIVNIRTPEELQDLNNKLYAEVVPQYANAHLIDWHTESTGHSKWFWNDGEHVRPEGAVAYINMIVREVTAVMGDGADQMSSSSDTGSENSGSSESSTSGGSESESSNQ